MNTPRLNLAFDAKTAEELMQFIKDHVAQLTTTDQSRINIKVNDLLALTGIDGLKALAHQIKSETGIDISWMIDGKWFDIPNTVANYARRLE